MKHRTSLSAVELCALVVSTVGIAGTANAIVPPQAVDGSISAAEYGSPALASQTNGTGFGDNFNELDALYAKVQPNGSLAVGLTGNLSPDNGIVLLIDSRAGQGGVANVDSNGFGHLGSIPGQYTDDWGTDTDGSQFPSPTPGGGSILPHGFNPDFAIEINNNDFNGGNTYFVNVIDLRLQNDPPISGLDNRDIFIGSNLVNGGSVINSYVRDGGFTFSGTIEHAFNNTNTQGVTADGDPTAGDPNTATTGLELLLSSDFLGTNQSSIGLMAFITNGPGDYLSNQILPGLPAGYHNLGGAEFDAPMYDASNTPGAAVANVAVPEPTTLGLLAVATAGTVRRRRRTA